MTGPEVTTTTLLSDKLALITHHHILTRVLVKLDLENWNYGLWEYFFINFALAMKSQNTFMALRSSRTNALKAELRSIKLGDLTMESYFRKIESIVTILASLDSKVNDEDVVRIW
ncbi:hypothetical protein Tco_0961025 [Tanacetum coccineum]